MNIRRIASEKKEYIELLLLADEQEDMVDKYLERGEMFILDDDGVKAECVITQESDGVYELKNIAVLPDYQRKGYGKSLIEFLFTYYSEGNVMFVGTGDCHSTLSFYNSRGFTESHRIKNFFGEVNFPTGEIVVADPLCYLHSPEYSHPLNHTVAAESYPVYISVCQLGAMGSRIVAAKLNITAKNAVRYEIATSKGKTIEQYKEPGVLAGFGVDAGLGCFCDKKTAEEYSAFILEWHKKNPDKNHYDDYFAAFFSESYHVQPNVQREGGDFIMWAIPETENRIAMFASGLGDGWYLALWGFDKDDPICELTIPFINPELFATIESERPKKQFCIVGADIKELINWNGASGCFATDRIVVDGCRVGYMYREKPDEGRPDSGWRFFSGDESDEYTNNPDNVGVYHLNTIANYDQDIIPLLNSPYGSAFGRDKNGVFQKEKL